jgi:hypothetical protein
MSRIPITALILLAMVASCKGVSETGGKWPPKDFVLGLQYTVVKGEVRQVRKSAKIFADGLVVYREADTTLRSRDGKLELPVYSRMCAYGMKWWSIRDLTRLLHDAPVLELADPAAAPPIGEETHLIRFHVTYMANHVDVVAQNQAVGLLNRVLRIVNTFLPPGHGITMPNMAGEEMEHHLQDVPVVTDSVAGALKFHEGWLSEHATNSALLLDTFSLACAAKNWPLAENCVTVLATSRPADVAALREILADCKAAAAEKPGG